MSFGFLFDYGRLQRNCYPCRYVPVGAKGVQMDRNISGSVLRRRQLETRLGLSRSTIYDKLNPKSPRHDPDFPKPIRLGNAAVGWLSDEVDEWLAGRIEASRSEVN